MTSAVVGALAALVVALPGMGPLDVPEPVPPPALPGQLRGFLPTEADGEVDGGATDDPGPTADLSRWRLTLPVAGDSGKAALVEPGSALDGPWLTTQPDIGLTFWAPVNGATTKNSTHPRTELISQTTWAAGSSRHTLTGDLAVWRVPSRSKDVIIGQIHGAGELKSAAFVMLHYTDGTIRVVVKKSRGKGGAEYDKQTLISGVPLGAWFTYTLSDTADGRLRATATYGSNTRTVDIPVPDAFTGATVRFQAGAYQLDDAGSGGGGADGGGVTYYQLVERP